MPKKLKTSSSSPSDILKKIKLFDSIAKYSIYVLVALLPIFFLPTPTLALDQAKIGLLILSVSAATVSSVLSSLYSGRIQIISKKVLIPAIVISAFTFLSSLLSTSYRGGLIGLGTELDSWYVISLLLLLVVLVASIVNTKERIFTALSLFWAGFGVASLFQIVRMLAVLFKSDLLIAVFNFGGIFTDSSVNTIGTWTDFSIIAGVSALSLGIILDMSYLDGLKAAFRKAFWLLFAIFATMSFISSSILIGSGIDQLTNGSQLVFPSMTFVGIIALVFALSRLFCKNKIIKNNKKAGSRAESKSKELAEDGVAENEKAVGSERDGLITINLPVASLILIILGIIVMISPLALNQKINHLVGVPDESVVNIRPGISDTYIVSKAVLRSSIKNALVGVGPHGFGIAWNKYRPDYVNKLDLWNTEYPSGVGYLMTIIVNNGILGFLLWAISLGALFIVGFLSLVGRRNKEKKAGKDIPNYMGVVTILSALLLWASIKIENPSSAVLILTFIFTGLLIGSLVSDKKLQMIDVSLDGLMFKRDRAGDNMSDSENDSKNENKNKDKGISKKKIAKIIFIAFTLVILCLAFTWVQRTRAQIYSTEAVQMIYAKNANISMVPKALDLLQKAYDIYPADVYARSINNLAIVKLNYDISSDPENQNLQALQAGQQIHMSSSTSAYLALAISSGKAALNANPNDFRNLVQFGSTLQSAALITGDQEAGNLALQAFLQAVNLAPNHPLPLYSLANLYVLSGDKTSAKIVLEQTIKIKPDFVEATEMYQKLLIDESASSTSTPAVSSSPKASSTPATISPKPSVATSTKSKTKSTTTSSVTKTVNAKK